jgi:molybdopterin-synthase adenylyltransferase
VTLAAAQASRYSRQELFAGLGPDGQARIRRARVAVVGCGALGSALAEMMARAGVAALTVVDRDYVETSNLQRQSLFDEADAVAGLPKAVAAEAKLRRVNGEVEVRGIVADLDGESAAGLLKGADVVLDGTDNFETRYLVNDLCVRDGRPWVYGACVGASGVALAVRPGVTPCLRCVLGERPDPGAADTCDTAGVIAPIVHVIAGVQAGEALKLLAGREAELLPGLVTIDLWAGQFEVVSLAGRAPSCPSCTARRFDYAQPRAADAAVLCGREAIQIRGREQGGVDLARLAERLRPLGEVTNNEHLVRFAAPEGELVVFRDGRAIVKGARDAAEARSRYARYVGA